jgi:peroxiredoxin
MQRESPMLALGTRAPDFNLPDPAGKMHALTTIAAGKPLLVVFICNHCPFVKLVATSFAKFAQDYQARGLAVVAISSNDIASHPEDAPPKMAEFARQSGFSFPYLYDEAQQVALAYSAICTPDFFLFDSSLRLAYRGQFDSSRPGGKGGATDGADMRAAADAVLLGKLPAKQIASAGCSIKWKPENRPEWA